MTKKYSLTPEHRAQFEPWRDKWIAIAMSTAGMSADEKQLAHTSVNGLYAAAKLPEPKHVVFVASPLVAAIAAGVAAGARYLREHSEKHQAMFGRKVTEQEIMGSIAPACSFAVRSGLYRTEFLKEAPAGTFHFEAVRSVGKNQPDAATRAATYAATRAATDDATDPVGARDVSRYYAMCVNRAWWLYHGGNQWAPWASYLSFFRHIVKLDESHGIDYSKWQHFEALAEHSGPRIMHKDFCLVCDRPEVLLVDERNRPHCATGPSHRWRDGWELHYWHGVRVSKRMIEQPESFTKEEILAIGNTETRRVLAERLGWGRFLEKIGGKKKDAWTDPTLGLSYELVELDETGDLVLRKQSPELKDESQPWYAEPVHRDLKTAQAARKWQAVVPFNPVYLRDPAQAARDCNKNPELSYSVEA